MVKFYKIIEVYRVDVLILKKIKKLIVKGGYFYGTANSY